MTDAPTLKRLLNAATSLIEGGDPTGAEDILDSVARDPALASLGSPTVSGEPRKLHSARLKLAKARADDAARIALQYHLVPPVDCLGPLFHIDARERAARVDAAAWPIPKILHQVWIGAAPPDTIGIWRAHAQRHGWDYRLWTDESLAEAGFDTDPVYQHMRARGDLPGAVDIARYHILAAHGGLYLDCDWLPVRNAPFETVFPQTGLSAMAEATPRLTGTGSPFLNNSVIAAPAAHPVFQQLVDCLPEAISRLPDAPAWWVTGPLVFTLAARAGPVCILDAAISGGDMDGSRAEAEAAAASLASSSAAYLLGWKPWA